MGMLLRRHKPKKEQEPVKAPVSYTEKAEPKKKNTKAKAKETSYEKPSMN